ncbi:4Fe-4S cluster-binding domain-containing protein [Enterococcus dongliensis]|uniref:4Fe-4S cluster-binding domain-containing protein n=1 Tax=Enterococcus dongliensis TaxID=2559925 RepID=UPI00289293C2|nr:4Fe-4S cluster-binding domain-containing protein [Enterococcus dongliensis]MDT2712006.1 radical SAM protein [Enterococcus dongliensis]
MKKTTVFNIQKFSTHDGPGIRTTIFFKGCPIKCEWCHNPESQVFAPEIMLNKYGKEEWIGKEYSIHELVKKIQADQIFYDQSGGGVTFSGGEVMAQNIDYVVELAQECQRLGITVAIDTCGVAPTENFRRILPYADLFLYDLKFIDSHTHQLYTGANNHLVLENLRFFSDHQAEINLRLILLDEINADEGTAKEIIDWLTDEGIHVSEISLLPYHDFGRDKYDRLQRTCTQNFTQPSDEQVMSIKETYQAAGYQVTIGG